MTKGTPTTKRGTDITPRALELFLEYARVTAKRFGISPKIGENVSDTNADRVTLAELYRARYAFPFCAAGDLYLSFTPDGINLAADHGIDVTE